MKTTIRNELRTIFRKDTIEDVLKVVIVFSSIIIMFGVSFYSFPSWPKDLDGKYKNSPYSKWFKSLKQPGSGASCCDVTDCKRTEFTIEGNSYRAIVNGKWMDVPPEKVISNVGNPVGQAIVCYPVTATQPSDIFCFVPGAGF